MGMLSEEEFIRKIREIRANANYDHMRELNRKIDEAIRNRMVYGADFGDFDTINLSSEKEGLFEGEGEFNFDFLVKEEWTTFVDGKESKTIDIYYLLEGTTITRSGKDWTATRKIQVSPQYNPGNKNTIEMQCINGVYIEPTTKYPKH